MILLLGKFIVAHPLCIKLRVFLSMIFGILIPKLSIRFPTWCQSIIKQKDNILVSAETESLNLLDSIYCMVTEVYLQYIQRKGKSEEEEEHRHHDRTRDPKEEWR
mmetsp:Transcript_45310/g.109700  ORF Transcript_45310/g.109700 Transcript_45310/m.109700 type:complete len:105 (+) Transcript_45310:324-638(+)